MVFYPTDLAKTKSNCSWSLRDGCNNFGLSPPLNLSNAEIKSGPLILGRSYGQVLIDLLLRSRICFGAEVMRSMTNWRGIWGIRSACCQGSGIDTWRAFAEIKRGVYGRERESIFLGFGVSLSLCRLVEMFWANSFVFRVKNKRACVPVGFRWK